MSAALALFAFLTLLSNLYCQSRVRRSDREAAKARKEAAKADERVKTLDAQRRVLIASLNKLLKAGGDLLAITDIQAGALALADTGREHWKTYALALEVLCECCAERDEGGAANAEATVKSEREMLRSLGEYDG